MYYLHLSVVYWDGVIPPFTSIFVGTTSVVYLPPVTLVDLLGLSSQPSSGCTLPLVAGSQCSSTTSRDFPRTHSHDECHCCQAILLFQKALLLKVIGNIPPHTFLPP